MSGTTDHDAAVADLPENKDDGKFFFSLQADEAGVTELKFRKNADRLFGTLLFAHDYINQSFEEPFPSVGDFLRNLAEIADKVEENFRNAQAQAQEAANDAGNGNPEPSAA
jgi:hypothetical protein